MHQLTNKMSSLLKLTARLFANDESTFFSTSTSPRCFHKQIFFLSQKWLPCTTLDKTLHFFFLVSSLCTGLCRSYFLKPAVQVSCAPCFLLRGGLHTVPVLSRSSHLKCTLAQTFRRHYIYVRLRTDAYVEFSSLNCSIDCEGVRFCL